MSQSTLKPKGGKTTRSLVLFALGNADFKWGLNIKPAMIEADGWAGEDRFEAVGIGDRLAAKWAHNSLFSLQNTILLLLWCWVVNEQMGFMGGWEWKLVGKQLGMRRERDEKLWRRNGGKLVLFAFPPPKA